MPGQVYEPSEQSKDMYVISYIGAGYIGEDKRTNTVVVQESKGKVYIGTMRYDESKATYVGGGRAELFLSFDGSYCYAGLLENGKKLKIHGRFSLESGKRINLRPFSGADEDLSAYSSDALIQFLTHYAKYKINKTASLHTTPKHFGSASREPLLRFIKQCRRV